ncbi:MAG TPA: dihydrolipoyl dehydrogenase [Candidatus Cloacimonadota bacterium]|nr:dihydrolipoyl dehydrogenase [Candidatus Cloacimonadota bacterium]
MEKYQVLIIGGGPGGYEAAIRLAQYEISTAVIEKERLGGICLNWGCIPTKTLVKTAELVGEIREAPEYGLPELNFSLDYQKVWERKNRIVEQLVSGVEFLFRKRKIPVFQQTATSVTKIDNGYNVKTADGSEYMCEYLILATGSLPKGLPGISIDEQNILSSTGILQLSALPGSMAIVGGGVIGCEFASILASFGVAVTIIEFLPRLIALEDEEISKRLTLALKKTGVKIITKLGVTSIRPEAGEQVLTLTDGSEVRAEKVLMSVGRIPALNIEFKDQELALERGAIAIADDMQTNLDKVYAIGDVTGKLQLAHTARKQGLLCVEHIRGRITGKPTKDHVLNYLNIPRCTFTNPEIASVGYTESEAKAAFGEIIVGKFPFAASGKAMAMSATQGFVKTIARKDTEELVGMHIMGPQAAELIAQGAILISQKTRAESIEDVVFAHPTLSEAIMESIEDLRSLAIHKI